MLVRFWGVRGSIPTPVSPELFREKLLNILEKADDADLSTHEKRVSFLDSLNYWESEILGGNTPCIEIQVNGQMIIFDFGSGSRELGKDILRRPEFKNGGELHIFITHTHWDHIQGFPFFQPAFKKNFTLYFYSPFDNLEERFKGQQDFKYFPVTIDDMPSKKIFKTIEPEGTFELDKVKIRNIEHYHPGKSYGYKIDYKGKSVIYATDAEYKNLSPDKYNDFLDFYRGADLLIFDAQYSFDQDIEKVDWGHSSAPLGVDLAVTAGIKNLALFHHDPDHSDFEIFNLLKEASSYKLQNYPESSLNIFISREAQKIEL